MKSYQLAWRNLWRNRRRSLITAASVFFALFFSLVLRSFQLGAYGKIYSDIIRSYSGYLQLQHPDYLDEPLLDNCFTVDPVIIREVEDDPDVTGVNLRLESFALAAAGTRTQGVMVTGIDSDSLLPLLHRHASVAGGFLSAGESGFALIGSSLSSWLGAGTGDTLVLMGQGYRGASASGRFVVKGVVSIPSPEIDNRLVCLTLTDAQSLYNAPGKATSAIIGIRETGDRALEAIRLRLQSAAGPGLAVRTWKEMNALLVNQLEADSRSGAIMTAILYLVIAFGVFGTVLMMMAERRREFAVLISIGMSRERLAWVVGLELLLMGLLGVAGGVAASLPVVFAGHARPLRFTGGTARMFMEYGFTPEMPMQLPGAYYLWQILVVLLILAAAISFSVRRIYNINVINALRV